MKKQEMKKIAQEVFKAYLETEENIDEIFIEENAFADVPECEDKNGLPDKKLINQLYEMLFEIFKESGYDIYKTGESYIYDGILKIVQGTNTIIAVNKESANYRKNKK